MKKIIVFIIAILSFQSAFASIDINLKYGQRGDDITELQEFLIDKGLLTSASTGFFGLLTLKAVQKYQTNVNVPSTGFVGIMTREKINSEINSIVDISDDAEKKENGNISEPENNSSLVQQVSILSKQLEEQKKLQEQSNTYISQIAKNTLPTTKQCQSGDTVAINDNCIKTCWDGEKMLDSFNCKEKPVPQWKEVSSNMISMGTWGSNYDATVSIANPTPGDIVHVTFLGKTTDFTINKSDINGYKPPIFSVQIAKELTPNTEYPYIIRYERQDYTFSIVSGLFKTSH